MRINANTGFSGAAGIPAAKINAQKPGAAKDAAGLDRPAELLAVLKQIPEVRADKVARARELLQDSSYPSDSVLTKVSDILAGPIQSGDSAG